MYKILFFSRSIFFLDESLYKYVQHKDSLVHKYDEKDIEMVFLNSIELKNFVEKRFIDIDMSVLQNFIFSNIFQEYRKCILDEELTIEAHTILRKKIVLFLKGEINIKILDEKNQLKYVLFKVKLLKLILQIKKIMKKQND